MPPLPPDDATAAQKDLDVTRWGLSDLAAALASGAVAVAFVAVRGYLRERGVGSASAVGLGLVLIGEHPVRSPPRHGVRSCRGA